MKDINELEIKYQRENKLFKRKMWKLKIIAYSWVFITLGIAFILIMIFTNPIEGTFNFQLRLQSKSNSIIIPDSFIISTDTIIKRECLTNDLDSIIETRFVEVVYKINNP